MATTKRPMAKKITAKKVVKQAVKKSATKKPVAKKLVKSQAAKKSVKASVTLQKKKSVSTARKAVASKVAKTSPNAKKTVANKAVAATLVKAAAQPQKSPVQLVEKKAPMTAKAPEKKGYAVGDYVVYPTHGVGRITGIEVEVIGEYELKVFVIAFEKDKMILRVPVGRAGAAGLRAISGSDEITRALTTLKGRAKIARGMWSRRAQEYEAKINSGNIVQIAEVVRDLHKNVDQSERSYSERMIYETAMTRLTGEVAAFDKVDALSAHEKLIKVLKKQAA
jgi:CarD family transcriptional regulator